MWFNKMGRCNTERVNRRCNMDPRVKGVVQSGGVGKIKFIEVV